MKLPVPRALAAAAFLFATPLAMGQSATAKTEPKPATAPPVATESGEKRFDLELVNATAADAVRQLGEKLGHPVNVIFTGDSGGTPLPDLQLRSVTLTEFFAALGAAGQAEQRHGRPGCVFAHVEDAPNIYIFSVMPPDRTYAAARSGLLADGATRGSTGVGAANLFTPAGQVANQLVARTPIAKEAGGNVAQKSTLFFDLSKILDKTLTIEDVTTAIRTGWAAATDGKEPAPDALKFHQESKLLIASGAPEQLEAVTSIIRLLENRTLPSKDEQERTIESLRVRIEEMNDQHQRLTKKMDELEKLKGETVNRLQEQIAKLEIELARRAKPQ